MLRLQTVRQSDGDRGRPGQPGQHPLRFRLFRELLAAVELSILPLHGEQPAHADPAPRTTGTAALSPVRCGESVPHAERSRESLPGQREDHGQPSLAALLHYGLHHFVEAAALLGRVGKPAVSLDVRRDHEPDQPLLADRASDLAKPVDQPLVLLELIYKRECRYKTAVSAT